MVADHLWATSYALTAADLYTKFPYKKLKANIGELPTSTGHNYNWLLTKVFRYFMFLNNFFCYST